MSKTLSRLPREFQESTLPIGERLLKASRNEVDSKGNPKQRIEYTDVAKQAGGRSPVKDPLVQESDEPYSRV